MPTKTEQLQILLTARQKTTLKRLARDAGRDVSSYVLARVLPTGDARLAELLRALRDATEPSYVLAELNDFLTACPPIEFPDAVATADLSGLGPYLRNYVSAMVESLKSTLKCNTERYAA